MPTSGRATLAPESPSPLTGRSILVTGGAGSFGRAFVRRALDDGARRVVIYSRDEAKQAGMQAAFGDDRLRFVIGDIRDGDRLSWAMRNCGIVVHAAALKRVEVCAQHPREARLTNVEGTGNVIDAAIERGVNKCLFLSTDKSADPTTTYGKSKALAEDEWLGANALGAGSATRFSCSRYGNVLDSRGSVVPTWRLEAQQSDAITVTEPRATRFWMTMKQAVDLVVTALHEMRGGEIFLPKIGSSALGVLAGAVAPLAEWKRVGLRPSEKMHEALITAHEARRTHDCGAWFVVEPEGRSWGDVAPLRAPLVPAGFAYRSDMNGTPLTVDELREMVAA